MWGGFDKPGFGSDYFQSGPSAPIKPQPKKKKNFWLDQISTAGGIIGGVAGTAVAPLLGTGVGAGAGSALGEAIENAITGDPLTKNVVKEGALGAVFGAGPLRLGKAAVGTASALKAGGEIGLKEAVKQGAKEGAEFSVKGALGNKVLKGGERAIAKQFRLTPSQLTNFTKKHGEDAIKVLQRYGIQSVDDVTAKGIQPLQSAFDEVVTQIPTISKKSLETSLAKVWKPLVKSANLSEQRLGAQLQKQAKVLVGTAGDSVDAATVNNLRKSFDNFVSYTMRGTPEHNVNKMTADALRKTLQREADKAGIGYQGKTFKEIGRDLAKLYDLDEVVGKQANLGRGSSPLKLTTLLGGAGGAAAAGPAGALASGLGVAALNSNTGRRVMAKGAETVGGKLIESGAKSAANSMGVRGVATRLGTLGAVRGISKQVEQNQPTSLEDALMQQDQSSLSTNSNQMAPNMIPATNNPMSANMGQGYNDLPTESSPYSRQNLMADIQRDPKNAEKYIQYYAALDEIFNPEAKEPKPLNQAQQERADLITALGLTENAVNQGSINFGPIGSRIEGVKAFFNAADPETLAYKNTVSGLRAAITKARAGASLTAGELKLLEKYTPSETDTEQVVRSKLAQLRALYGYQAPTQGANTLEDALMQYQGAY